MTDRPTPEQILDDAMTVFRAEDGFKAIRGKTGQEHIDALPAVLDVVDGRCDECRRTPYPDPEACRCGPPSVWDGHPLTCQTCNGSKTVPFESFLAAGTVACPACVDSHPIIDVQVTCSECHSGDPMHPLPTCLTGYRTVRVSISAHLRDDGRYDIIATEAP